MNLQDQWYWSDQRGNLPGTYQQYNPITKSIRTALATQLGGVIAVRNILNPDTELSIGSPLMGGIIFNRSERVTSGGRRYEIYSIVTNEPVNFITAGTLLRNHNPQ